MQEIPDAAGAPSENHLQVPKEHLLVSENHLQVPNTHLQVLARDEQEETVYNSELELEILQRALKDCVRNMQAWESNERRNYGNSDTNKAGAARYRQKAQAIEQRIKELQDPSTV